MSRSSRPTNGSLSLVSLIAIMVAGCQASALASPSAAESVGATASVAESAVERASPAGWTLPARPTDLTTDGSCDEERECFGILKPRSYLAENFDPPVRFTIPGDGYVNTRSSGGIVNVISLRAPGDEMFLFQRPSPRTADDKAVAGIGRTVDDFIDWLTARDDLLTTEPEATSVGGLDGVWLDVSVREDAGGGLHDCPGDPCVMIAHGLDESPTPSWGWDFGLWRGAAVRMYVLDAGSQRLMLTVMAWDGSQLEDVVGDFQPIIDSLRFESMDR